ncbi:hypothetical protein ACEWBC_17735 [Vibrio parahaemolyticus]|nr:hypothetical protein [Vibrio parahaemolyticus]NVJ67800.1 hypothetical protein [Gammaproteobacteria bacterium]
MSNQCNSTKTTTVIVVNSDGTRVLKRVAINDLPSNKRKRLRNTRSVALSKAVFG